MAVLILSLYFLCLTAVCLYSLAQFQLAYTYYRKKKSAENQSITWQQTENRWPKVAIQLPIYNERYVVQRLLQKVAELDYPSHLLQIQVLDDSDDDTSNIIKEQVAELRHKELCIVHLQRAERKGYKAGALQYGLEQTDAEFLAIFDADFLPEPDFLRKTIPYFQKQEVGVVQTRWGHLNQRYSLLTKLQAFGLDAHFAIEQTGRSLMGNYISFNGTAGIWRKSCITTSGNWHYDTLTEDLDLSYRAQMKGWEFIYLEDVVTPAELPVLMGAIKSQQFRWNKGAAESAKKHLGAVLRSPIPFSKKVHAFFHLANSTMFMLMMLSALLSIPSLFIKHAHPELAFLVHLASIFLIGFLGISFFYWVSAKNRQPGQHWGYFFRYYPAYLSLYMGLSFYNSVAVLEGWLGKKTAFIRTPKLNITTSGNLQKNAYFSKLSFSWVELSEGLLACYFAFGVASAFYFSDFGLLAFHLLLTFGFGMVFFLSILVPKH